MAQWLKFLAPTLAWALTLFLVVQYYLVFPGAFATLPSDFQTDHPKVTIAHVSDEDGAPKSLYYDAKRDGAELVVFFHGNYETVDQNFSAVAQLTGMKNDVLLVEYPGFGDAEGWPMPGTIITNTLTTLEKYRKPGQGLVIWGRSLGGAFAVEMATRMKPDALILESTFMHPLNALGSDWVTTALKPLFFLDLDSGSKLDQLALDLPVLLLHGDQDPLFDLSISNRMKMALSPRPVKQIVYAGSHNQRNYPFDSVQDFLDENLADH